VKKERKKEAPPLTSSLLPLKMCEEEEKGGEKGEGGGRISAPAIACHHSNPLDYDPVEEKGERKKRRREAGKKDPFAGLLSVAWGREKKKESGAEIAT